MRTASHHTESATRARRLNTVETQQQRTRRISRTKLRELRRLLEKGLSVKQAAAKLQVSERTAYRMMERAGSE